MSNGNQMMIKKDDVDDDINDDDDAAFLRRPCIPCVRSRLRTVLLRDHVI